MGVSYLFDYFNNEYKVRSLNIPAGKTVQLINGCIYLVTGACTFAVVALQEGESTDNVISTAGGRLRMPWMFRHDGAGALLLMDCSFSTNGHYVVTDKTRAYIGVIGTTGYVWVEIYYG